ncbi:hypothetical protein THIOSC15_2390012 [uncultured Thiomicrorhabdus sp.]
MQHLSPAQLSLGKRKKSPNSSLKSMGTYSCVSLVSAQYF